MGALNAIDCQIGARLRARRKDLRLSLEKCGALLGVTYQQIQKYETGANRVSASALAELARGLGVPVAYFFGEDTVPALPADAAELVRGLDRLPAEIRANLLPGLTNFVARMAPQVTP